MKFCFIIGSAIAIPIAGYVGLNPSTAFGFFAGALTFWIYSEALS